MAADLSGEKFGTLAVVKRYSHNSIGLTEWLCKCSNCGKENVKAMSQLIYSDQVKCDHCGSTEIKTKKMKTQKERIEKAKEQVKEQAKVKKEAKEEQKEKVKEEQKVKEQVKEQKKEVKEQKKEIKKEEPVVSLNKKASRPGKDEDLRGRQFGCYLVKDRIDVKDKDGHYWLCECKCGKTKPIRVDALPKKSDNCTCNYKQNPRKKSIDSLNMVGKRFGKLVVDSYFGKIGVYKAWNCLCDCGETTVVLGRKLNLSSYPVRSCGCSKKENKTNNSILKSADSTSAKSISVAHVEEKKSMNLELVSAGPISSEPITEEPIKEEPVIADPISEEPVHIKEPLPEKAIDLTGKVFHYLTVREYAGKKGQYITWLCDCKCGNTKIIPSYNLLRGDTKSCGCYKKEINSRRLMQTDVIKTPKIVVDQPSFVEPQKAEVIKRKKRTNNFQFGNLTVIQKNNSKNWLCRCKCGTVLSVEQSSLTRKDNPMIHCGCQSIKEIVGKYFGQFLVLGRSSHFHDLALHCQCDKCGKLTDIPMDKLEQNTAICSGCEPIKYYLSTKTIRIKQIFWKNNMADSEKAEKIFNTLNKLAVKDVG